MITGCLAPSHRTLRNSFPSTLHASTKTQQYILRELGLGSGLGKRGLGENHSVTLLLPGNAGGSWASVTNQKNFFFFLLNDGLAELELLSLVGR